MSGIQNIIVRVTGTQRSLIDGLLSVNGSANLFFLNPNGITFGQNARLGINGSFVASTGDSWKFPNGNEYSATNPQAPPLLTISTPIGLQFGTRPGSIINQARLAIPPGGILALAGEDINLDSGSLNSLGGNIFLVSAASSGSIQLRPTTTGLQLAETNIQQFGNIELSGTASVNASGLGGGAIQILGNQLTLRDRATILSDTAGAIDGRDIEIQVNQFSLRDRAIVRAATIGTGKGGNISIRARDTISMIGAGYAPFEQNYLRAGFSRTVRSTVLESAILTGTFGAGQAGNVTIEANNLNLSQGAAIGSPTQGSGNGGNLTIRVADTIRVTSSGMGTTAGSSGNSGNLLVQTGNLILDNTGILTTNTFGDGDSGNLTVQATDTVLIRGRFPGGFLGSNLSNSTVSGAGNAGNLVVNARSIRLENGGTISSASGSVADRIFTSSGIGGTITLNASEDIRLEGINAEGFANIISTNTFGGARAGDININTRRLESRDRSLIVASTFGSGRGGTVTIRASESIQIEGRPDDAFGIGTSSGKGAFLRLFGASPATGTAGDVRIFTPRLTLQDQGTISVGSLSSGNAGSILVNADEIRLNNGIINAGTNSGGKGNIDLRSRLLLLRNNSRITTDAGSSDGGNIDVRADVLFTIPTENSDITATATQGRGGNINIAAQGIFGFEQSKMNTARSDITASSSVGLDGTVTLTQFETEPNVTSELPIAIVNNTSQIAQTCARFAKTNQFVITARGGLEPTINEWAQSTPVWSDQRGTVATRAVVEQAEIVEATQWVRQADGAIALVADAPLSRSTISCTGEEL